MLIQVIVSKALKRQSTRQGKIGHGRGVTKESSGMVVRLLRKSIHTRASRLRRNTAKGINVGQGLATKSSRSTVSKAVGGRKRAPLGRWRRHLTWMRKKRVQGRSWRYIVRRMSDSLGCRLRMPLKACQSSLHWRRRLCIVVGNATCMSKHSGRKVGSLFRTG